MDLSVTFYVLLALAALGALLFSLTLNTQEPNEPNESAEKIAGLNFIPTQMFMGNDGLGGLAVNERTHQICLFNSPSSTPRLISTTDLFGSFLVRNGEIIGEGKRRYPQETQSFLNKHHRQQESLIKKLHITATHGSTQRIDLLVVINDQDNPILVVNFLDMETKEGGILFEKSMSTATHWHNVLDVLMLEADQLARFQTEAPPENEPVNAAP